MSEWLTTHIRAGQAYGSTSQTLVSNTGVNRVDRLTDAHVATTQEVPVGDEKQTGSNSTTRSSNEGGTTSTTVKPSTTQQVTESAVGTTETTSEDIGATVTFSIIMTGKVPVQPA